MQCCAAQRDVLGLTRAAVPILAASGVDALTVGCNGAGAPPGVPKNQPFIWRDVRTSTEIVAMWHAGPAPFPPGWHSVLLAQLLHSFFSFYFLASPTL